MTALTLDDLDNLTALAEAATAGPWEAWQTIATAEFNISQRGREYFGLIATPARGRDDYGRADAAFIAAADPPTISALLALVAALREARAANEGRFVPVHGAAVERLLEGEWQSGWMSGYRDATNGTVCGRRALAGTDTDGGGA